MMDTEYIQRGVKDAIKGRYNREGMSGDRLDSYWVGYMVCRTMMDNMPPVTRPDPSRAEMAMAMMAASISNHQTVADSKEDFKEEMEQLAWASTVAADALIAALARKEKA